MDLTGGIGIAVIGMACRVPGAADAREFWALLEEGRDSLAPLDDAALAAAGVPADLRARPDYVKAAHVLADIDCFAADFFGFSPGEAALMDPQQRLFLELAHDALDDGGYGAGRSALKVGVFAGSSMSTYFLSNLFGQGPLDLDALQARVANEKDYLTLRVGHKLNLRGPCVSIQTACSTSLVAIATACESLRAGGTDMALAGGISITVPQATGYLYRKGGLLSPDGHCRAFSARAAGTVPGNGAGVVLLKRLDEAQRAGDHLYAVIRGTAVNNDGAAKIGFTAPGAEGQIAVIQEAQKQAGITADALSYIECHGTGTALGDPVEMSALSQAFRGGTQRTGYCAIGSVKTNIGHLDCAAGVAGFIKTVLALHHRQIPASLYCERPNPAIDFAGSPFFVNTTRRPWDTGGAPRLAGISSFGIGGTNAHVIVQEAPRVRPSGPSGTHQVLPLSARSQTSLQATYSRLATYLRANPGINLADAAFTLACGRAHYAHRRALVCRTAEEALRMLTAGPEESRPAAADAPLLLICPGAPLAADPAQAMWHAQRAFRDGLQRAADALRAAGQPDLRLALDTGRWDDVPAATGAVFAAEYAMATLWRSWGLAIDAVVGSGAGDAAAAAIAGLFSLDAAARRACGLPGLEAPRQPDLPILSAAPPADADGWRRAECGLWPAGDLAAGLAVLATLWESGGRVDWPTFYAGQRRQRVPLPTYPFERARYWREPPVAATTPIAPAPATSWFHHPVWRRLDRIARPEVAPRRTWLVCDDAGELGRALCRQLRAAGQESILAETAPAFEVLGEGAYRLDLTNVQQVGRLLGHVRGGSGVPQECVHLAGLGASSEAGLVSLQTMLQALWSRRDADQMRIRSVGAGLLSIVGDEAIEPERALQLGVSYTGALEQKGTRCEVIDIGTAPSSSAEGERVAERLVAVLFDDTPAPLTVLRGKYRWRRDWEPLVSPATAPTLLRERGIYLITGGLGGVGAAIAGELAARYHARLALVGRQALPPASEWDRWLASGDEAVAQRIRRVRAIEARGGDVVSLRGDVARPADAAAIVAATAERFGGLHGIIHAAGVPGGISLRSERIDLGRGAFPAKVDGTRALWEASRPLRPDFIALMSSVLSLTGFPGMADYCAANAFLDAFAARHDQDGGTHVVSINWGMWRWNAWEEHFLQLDPARREQLREIRREWGFADEEGAQAFLRALDYRLPQIAVSKHGGFAPAAAERSSGETAASVEAPRGHARPELDNAYVPPRDGLEAEVADIWQELLGLEQVGREDHFLDLGGHSLLALDLVARLRSHFGIDLDAEVIVTAPTVATLSDVLAAAGAHESPRPCST